MNTMHVADEQTRMLAVDLAGANMTRDDKSAFDDTIHRISNEQAAESERTGTTPRAQDLAELIAASLRETLTERGHGLAKVAVRPLDPNEQEAFWRLRATMGDDDAATAAPDQANIVVSFSNGTVADEKPQDLRSLLIDMVDTMASHAGDTVMEPLPPCIIETGHKHADATMKTLIEPGLLLFANDDWLAKAREASPRGVQGAALALMARVLDYDYTTEICAMNERTGPASGLLRRLLVKAGRACSEADENDGILYSYLMPGENGPPLWPWKEGTPVPTMNAVISAGIVVAMETVGEYGGQYKRLHERANDTGQTGRFRYHALRYFEGADTRERALHGLNNLHKVIGWTAGEYDQIKDEAKRASAMADEALRNGTDPADARVQ